MPFALVRWCVRALGSPLCPLGHLISAGGPAVVRAAATRFMYVQLGRRSSHPTQVRPFATQCKHRLGGVSGAPAAAGGAGVVARGCAAAHAANGLVARRGICPLLDAGWCLEYRSWYRAGAGAASACQASCRSDCFYMPPEVTSFQRTSLVAKRLCRPASARPKPTHMGAAFFGAMCGGVKRPKRLVPSNASISHKTHPFARIFPSGCCT
jgi:hypothetical protein